MPDDQPRKHTLYSVAVVLFATIRLQRWRRLDILHRTPLNNKPFGWTNLYRAAVLDNAFKTHHKDIFPHCMKSWFSGSSQHDAAAPPPPQPPSLIDARGSPSSSRHDKQLAARDAQLELRDLGKGETVEDTFPESTPIDVLRQSSKPLSCPKRTIRRALRMKIHVLAHGIARTKCPRPLILDDRHWLEAIDPKHRYGSYLQQYFNHWNASDTRESFFYWLDVGQGVDVDLPDCPRKMLEKARVKYLGASEREKWQVFVSHGVFRYKYNDDAVHNSKPGVKLIFACDLQGRLYIAPKVRGVFHHSSLLAGGPAIAAGHLKMQNGCLEAITPHSGHYRPSEEDFNFFLGMLATMGVSTVGVTIGTFKSRVKAVKIPSMISKLASSRPPSPPPRRAKTKRPADGLLQS